MDRPCLRRPGRTAAQSTAAQGIADMSIQTERKVTDRKSVTFLYISNVSSAQDSLQAGDSSAPAQDRLQANVSSAQDRLQAKANSAQTSLQAKVSSCSRSIASKRQFRSGFIAGKSQLPLRIDCKQTSVLLRLLVVVQRAASGEVVDLALDVLQNRLVLFGTFLGDTVDNIGVLCNG